MQLFTQQVVTIGKITPRHVQMLGTGFFVSSNKVATTRHVVGNQDEGIVFSPRILMTLTLIKMPLIIAASPLRLELQILIQLKT